MDFRVGFIGLGEMGKWMAINVAKAGYPLMVCDIRPEPMKDLVAYGAKAGKYPVEVSRNANCTLLSLPDTEAVENVIFGKNGLIDGISPGSNVVEQSTV